MNRMNHATYNGADTGGERQSVSKCQWINKRWAYMSRVAWGTSGSGARVDMLKLEGDGRHRADSASFGHADELGEVETEEGKGRGRRASRAEGGD